MSTDNVVDLTAFWSVGLASYSKRGQSEGDIHRHFDRSCSGRSRAFVERESAIMVAEDHRALTSGPGTLVTVLPIGAREVHGLSKEYSDDSMTVLPRYRTPRG